MNISMLAHSMHSMDGIAVFLCLYFYISNNIKKLLSKEVDLVV